MMLVPMENYLKIKMEVSSFGLRKCLDPVVVIFFKYAKKSQVSVDTVVVNFFDMDLIQLL